MGGKGGMGGPQEGGDTILQGGGHTIEGGDAILQEGGDAVRSQISHAPHHILQNPMRSIRAQNHAMMISQRVRSGNQSGLSIHDFFDRSQLSANIACSLCRPARSDARAVGAATCSHRAQVHQMHQHSAFPACMELFLFQWCVGARIAAFPGAGLVDPSPAWVLDVARWYKNVLGGLESIGRGRGLAIGWGGGHLALDVVVVGACVGREHADPRWVPCGVALDGTSRVQE